MRTKVLIVCLMAALSACGHDKSGGGGGGNGSPEKLNKVTNAQNCLNGAPATSLYRMWQTEFKSPSMSLRMIFDFSSDSRVEVTNECRFSAGQLSSAVAVAYVADASNITIAARGHNAERRNGMYCEVSIEAGSVHYSFENSCLVMTNPNGEKIYLLPY